jgi:hypothetical protein
VSDTRSRGPAREGGATFPADPTRKILSMPVPIPGRALTATLYSTKHRRLGRRIVVRGADGKLAFDTDDCYDLANANNSFERWLTTMCAHCGQGDNGYALGAQDAETSQRICDKCARKVAPAPTHSNTPAEPACVRVPAVATGAPAECPF